MALIYTTKGEIDEALLEKKLIVEDYPDATVTATEYFLGDELVKRDVDVALKGRDLNLAQASF